jgi:hypothetical protein
MVVGILQGFGSGSSLIRIRVKSWIRIRMKSRNGAVEDRGRSQCRLKRVSRGVFRPVVADPHHFDEEQDPDPH